MGEAPSEESQKMYPEDAPIHDPKYCKKPEDVTYRNSDYVEELRTGKLVYVVRTTKVIY
jgi:hypothetical protein